MLHVRKLLEEEVLERLGIGDGIDLVGGDDTRCGESKRRECDER
ncbi:hypothetical protein ABIA42_007235 [Bradyrhizobium sp. USDA 327]